MDKILFLVMSYVYKANNPKLIYKLRKAKFRIVGLQAQN